ncbi:MAG TPA: glycosyltransferase [Elusimicrobiales bacterium]|nr:glycosyltransferase [Elusimicrobiales bacterium]
MILPCIDERGNIVELIKRLLSSLRPPYDILVVDDDSADGTGELARSEFQDNGAVRVLIRKGERGLASALGRGISETDGGIVAWMDCDLSMPPETMGELVSAVRAGRYDAAVGSRFLPGGGDRRMGSGVSVPAAQAAFSLLMSRLCRSFIYGGLSDWTSGFIAVRRTALPVGSLGAGHGEYFMRLIHSMLASGRAITEIPYCFVPRSEGSSKTAGTAAQLAKRGICYMSVFLECARKGV